MKEASSSKDRGRTLNLNSLPVLRELLRQKNVTHAAAALNMSQSAVSDALARLRHIFDDELLIPSGRGFVMSEKAKQLEAGLSEALHHIEVLLNAKPFEPAEASGRIRIAASDYATLAIGPELVRRLEHEAPEICVQFHDADEGSIAALDSGQIDFVLMPEAMLLSHRNLERAFLFEDELVLMEDASSAQTSRVYDAEAVSLGAPVYPFSEAMPPDKPVIRQGFGDEDMETVVLPAFLLLPFFVENSAIAALVQRRLAERLMPAAAVRISSPPFATPSVRLFVAWNSSRNKDPLHRWLRDLMVEIGANSQTHPVT